MDELRTSLLAALDRHEERVAASARRLRVEIEAMLDRAAEAPVATMLPPPPLRFQRGREITSIATLVAQQANLSLAQILGRNLSPHVAEVRQIAMYVARKVTGQSLVAIGRAFRRDHTTVGHALEQVEARMDPDLRAWIDRIVATLRGEHTGEHPGDRAA
jgi:hypothetical protein